VHALPDLVPEEGSLSSLANPWVVHVNLGWNKSSLTWKCMLCLLIKGRHDLLMMKMQELWEKVLWWWHKWHGVRQVDRFGAACLPWNRTFINRLLFIFVYTQSCYAWICALIDWLLQIYNLCIPLLKMRHWLER
jgi:hypothetical protein